MRHLSRKIHVDLNRRPRLKKIVLRLLAYKYQLAKGQMYSLFYQKPVSE